MPNNVYSLKDRIQIIQLFYASGGSYRSVTREFNKDNPRGPKMSCNTVIRMIQKFETTGCLNADHAIIKHPSRAIPEECRVEICEIAKREPERSLRKISFDVGLSVSTVRRVLKDENLSEYYKRVGKEKKPEELKEELLDIKKRKLNNIVDDEEEDEDDMDDDLSDEEEEDSEDDTDEEKDVIVDSNHLQCNNDTVTVKKEINYEDDSLNKSMIKNKESVDNNIMVIKTELNNDLIY